MTDKDSRINALLDREEIRMLRLHYSQLLDSGEAERMGEVFTQDAEIKVTVGSMQGLEKIIDNLKQAYHSFDTKARKHFPFLHAVTNHNITLIDQENATGRCYLLDFVTDRDVSDHPVLLLGRYLDRYERIDGEWRIAQSELDVVWPAEGI
ncbi:MAG TPA: nuclear transport factor 2 family protein [Psychromonas sp.]